MASTINRKRKLRRRQVWAMARRLDGCRRAAAGGPCLVCLAEGPGAVLTWVPSPDLARRLVLPNGRKPLYIYKLCPDCLRRGPAIADRIEELVLIQAGHLLVPASSN